MGRQGEGETETEHRGDGERETRGARASRDGLKEGSLPQKARAGTMQHRPPTCNTLQPYPVAYSGCFLPSSTIRDG